jgi:hypothetical protein
MFAKDSAFGFVTAVPFSAVIRNCLEEVGGEKFKKKSCLKSHNVYVL